MQRNGVPFGGVSVILLGDALQLKPVSYINSKASLVITGQTYIFDSGYRTFHLDGANS